ncbi:MULTISPECIES: glycosyltransferase family 39 protein [unclassified Nostoc]|uniref:glycosyltransferase family 39 protein n=1 Tax=unclassified Nostoc TaxID=2593658 RepID=UPI002AD4CD25|nr:glycosyltransferase family 39 protein [Nostoc sp. DedQUE03]MDZ7976947.1 glycosyltransferase family 39 protein [Nostoc sp. DedQUE03]MDZ8043305.1 glycosyltransferase family 39 protein [Nostoc sp. DedQUE02]
MRQPKYYFSFIIIIIISIFLRFYLLPNQSLWYDEGWSLILSDGSTFQENLSKIINNEAGDKYQPLYYLLLFYWRSAFGDNEFAIRSLSALLGVGSVIAIFFTTLRIYGKKHALWSSLLLAVSSFSVFYSQDARPYALLIFLASLQIYFFSHSIQEDKSNKIISQVLFGILTAIGSFGSILIIIFSLALSFSHIIVYRNFKEWIKWWIPSVIFSSPMVLFYLSSPAVSDPTATIVTRAGLPIIQNIMFVIYGILVGTSYGPPLEQLRGEEKISIILGYWPHFLILFIVITVIFIALVKSLLRQDQRKIYQQANYFFASLLVTSFLLAFLFALATKINWLPRHSFYLCIPVVILIPSAFLHKYPQPNKLDRMLQIAKLTTVFLVIMNVYSNFQYYGNPAYAKDDYRSAVRYISQHRDQSAKSVLLYGQPRLFKYYGDSSTFYAPEYVLKTINGKNLAEKVNTITQNANTVFVIINREFYWKLKDVFKTEMSDLYNLQNEASWPYMKIYRFARKK